MQQRKVLSIQHLQCGQPRVSSRPRTSGGRRPGTLAVGSSSQSEPSCCPVEECQLLGITYKVDTDANAVVTSRRTVTWILTTVTCSRVRLQTWLAHTITLTRCQQVRALCMRDLSDTSTRVPSCSTSACTTPCEADLFLTIYIQTLQDC